MEKRSLSKLPIVWFLQVFVDTLVKKAYDNWISVVEYDGKSLLNFNQSKSSGSSQTEVVMGPQDYPNSFDHQLTLPSLPVSVPPQQPSVGPSITVGGMWFGCQNHYSI